jgi:hypothetical protein
MACLKEVHSNQLSPRSCPDASRHQTTNVNIGLKLGQADCSSHMNYRVCEMHSSLGIIHVAAHANIGKFCISQSTYLKARIIPNTYCSRRKTQRSQCAWTGMLCACTVLFVGNCNISTANRYMSHMRSFKSAVM